METQILNQIRRTNELLEWAVYLLATIVALWILRSAFAIFSNWKNIKKDSLNELARDLYRQEKYYELIDLCSKNLKKKPKDLYSLYWKAKAQNKSANKDGLKETVESLLDVAPRWKEDWMEEYLDTKQDQPKG